MAEPQKERETVSFLPCTDQLAQRRLRDPQMSGGVGKIADTRDGDQITELPCIHLKCLLLFDFTITNLL